MTASEITCASDRARVTVLLSAEAVFDITNREMAARLLDQAAILGGVPLGAALVSLGKGFLGEPYDIAWRAWAEICEATTSGETAHLQRQAATCLRETNRRICQEH